MADALALFARFSLAAVFMVAAAAKLKDREGTQEALKAFGVPDALSGTSTYLLPVAEALATVLLILPATYRAGAIWSLVLLVVFTTAIVVNLARGNRVECRCFGEISTAPIGVVTVVRNAALSGLAIVILANAPTTLGGVETWYDGLTNEGRRLAITSGILLGLLALAGYLLLRLSNLNRTLNTTLETMTAAPPEDLPLGAEAPAFELPTVGGGSLSLDVLKQRGKPIILAFTDPECGPCSTLFPQLAMWQKSLPNVFTVAVASRGRFEDNVRHADEFGFDEVMVQKADEVADAYRSAGTPSAVMITPEGTIGSPVAIGVPAVSELFEAVIADHAQELWKRSAGSIPQPHFGLPLGSEPPKVSGLDLNGETCELRDLVRGQTMLVFWSPRCAFCHQMTDDMRALEARLPEDHRLVFVTAGTPEENRYMGLKSTMLLDPEFEIGRHFEASGTPSAVLIQEGVIASSLESGVDPVNSLAERFAGPVPHSVEAPTMRRTK